MFQYLCRSLCIFRSGNRSFGVEIASLSAHVKSLRVPSLIRPVLARSMGLSFGKTGKLPAPDPASGTSVDYAHSLGVPFTYALELRPEDADQTHGFLYPAEYIVPTGKETFEALKAIAKEIHHLYSRKP